MILRTFTSSSFAVRQRRRRVAVITAMVVTAGACSGDDGAVSTIPIVSTTTEVPLADPPTTDTVPSSVGVTPPDSSTTPGTDEPPPTTAVPTTDGPTTVESTPVNPTTVPLPTSLNPGPDERLRATIARDFLRAERRGWDIASNPTRPRLEARVAQVVAKNSPAYHDLLASYLDLIESDERVRLGVPPTLKIIVEDVRFVGRRPYARALVTFCDVSNSYVVRERANGESELVRGSRELDAVRYRIPVRVTGDGWRRYTAEDTYVDRWEGAQLCPGA